MKIPDLKSTVGDKLLHDTGYYTLNEVPGGQLKSPATENMTKALKGIVQEKRVNEMPLNWTEGPDQKVAIGTKRHRNFQPTHLPTL